MPLWLRIIVAVFALNAIAVIVTENRRPANAWAWILLLLTVPGVGLIVYYLFGTRASRFPLISTADWQRLKQHSEPQIAEQVPDYPLVRLLQSINTAYPIAGNATRLYTTFTAMWEDMQTDIAVAKESVHFQFFKFEDDQVGQQVSNLLIAKALQGVEVRVLYDAAACWMVPHGFFRRLRKNGVMVEPFNRIFPFLTPFSNYRNHRKVVVIDGRVGYLGGMNIAERYKNGVHGGIWRDTHLRISGPAVSELQTTFLMDWHFAAKRLLCSDLYYPYIAPQGPSLMQIVSANPSDPWRVMNQSLTLLVARSNRYVYLQSPYFLPTESLMNALCSAAQASIDVRLMLPIRGDKGVLVPKASCSFYERALRAGVRIYLYQNGYLHAKTAVSDDAIVSVGSTNIDPRSLRLSFEVNAFIYDAEVAQQQRDIFLHDMYDCHMLTLEEWQQRSRLERLKESLARLFMPIL